MTALTLLTVLIAWTLLSTTDVEAISTLSLADMKVLLIVICVSEPRTCTDAGINKFWNSYKVDCTKGAIIAF